MSLMMNLSDDNLSPLSIFLNLHILKMAKICYSKWPKYSKCSVNDIKTTNLLYFVLLHNCLEADRLNIFALSIHMSCAEHPLCDN